MPDIQAPQEKLFTRIKNARVMPLLGSMDAFTAGVFDGDECLPGSLLYRGSPSPLYPVRERLKGAYIFGGYLFGHFGHFLWESLSRLHALRRCAPLPILFLSPNPQIYTLHERFFALLGLKNKLLLLKSPAEVETLIYSPPGSSLEPLFITDAQLEALAAFPPPAVKEPPGGTSCQTRNW